MPRAVPSWPTREQDSVVGPSDTMSTVTFIVCHAAPKGQQPDEAFRGNRDSGRGTSNYDHWFLYHMAGRDESATTSMANVRPDICSEYLPPIGGGPLPECQPAKDDQSLQCESNYSYTDDKGALYLGTVTYDAYVVTNANDEVILRVAVQAATKVELPPAALPPGRVEEDVTVGGRVRLVAVPESGSVAVESLADEIQPVISSGDQATWRFRLTPSEAGNFPVILTFTVLRGETSEALHSEEKTVTIHSGGTFASALQQLSNLLLSWQGILASLAVIGGAILAASRAARVFVAGVIGRLFKRRNRDSVDPAPSSNDPSPYL